MTIGDVLPIFMASCTGAVIGNVLWNSLMPGRYRVPNDVSAESSRPAPRPLEPNRVLKPFAKPTGKRTPKANDDVAGWRKENERDLV